MRYPLDGEVHVTSPYGPRDSGFHQGTDLFAVADTPAYAVADGDCYYASPETAGGNVLWMHVANPPVWQAAKVGYMHLSGFAVGPGTPLREGDLIGWTGYTGDVRPAGPDGAHLHLQFGTGSATVDPVPYLSSAAPAPAPPPASGHQPTPYVVDFQYARPSVGELLATGYRDVIVYLGNPHLSGDACPSRQYLDTLTAMGIRYTFIYETDPHAALQGYGLGVEHAQFADQRAAERGYPPEGPFFVCASDGSSGDPSSGGDAIAAYARGFADTTGRKLAAYGNRYAINAFNLGVRAVNPDRLVVTGLGRDGGWIPTTWGADPARDLIGQDPNVKLIDGTDHNHIYADWWPTAAPEAEEEEDMAYTAKGPDGQFWCIAGNTKHAVDFGFVWSAAGAAGLKVPIPHNGEMSQALLDGFATI